MTLSMQLSLDDAEARDEEWATAARRLILALAPGDRFDSDWLHERLGDPSGLGNSVGAVIHSLQNAGAIAFTGESVMSSRPSARGRWVRIWTRL